MKKFAFSLESVLNLRKDKVKKTQQEMAPVVKRYNELLAAKERILNTLNSSGYHQRSHLRELNDLYREIEREQKPVKETLEEHQKILAEKLKDLRVLEILKERQYTEWKKIFLKRNESEQLELIQSFF